MEKKILIDCTLTGGRGPAKKAAEFIWECQRRSINYFLLTDLKLAERFKELDIKPDQVLNIDFNSADKEIYSVFEKNLRLIDFDLLVKFGARVPGPYVARALGKPYIIIDGGLPDRLEQYPSLYDSETYFNAEKYILTTNFPWKPDLTPRFTNVKVCYFPISKKTQKFVNLLKTKKKSQIIRSVSKMLTNFPKKYDLVINLSMTDDYVQYKSRTTYGAWLKTKQYDQTVGFI